MELSSELIEIEPGKKTGVVATCLAKASAACTSVSAFLAGVFRSGFRTGKN